MTSQDLPHPDAESVFAAWLSQPEPDGKLERAHECGVLAHGFARLRCGGCREDVLHSPRARLEFGPATTPGYA